MNDFIEWLKTVHFHKWLYSKQADGPWEKEIQDPLFRKCQVCGLHETRDFYDY